ncbi:MAG: AAA family ATPase [Terrimicrobiaceae bacterium]|nr:AAA family ATPase [Terrimicrobiaceae bacterium]
MSTTIQQPLNITGSLLHPAIIEQAAAKVGIFGPQGSGKTLTSALIALGLSKTYHNSAPVAFMDTENGSDYLVPIFEAEGVPLLNFKSRAFKDMCQGLRDAEASGCCAYLVDSYTHPWRELNDSLKKKLKVSKLEFRHMDQLKGMWMGWTDLMLNSQQHVIVSGRLGYVWDREEDDNGKKGDLIKLGTKMKSESEAGYEPSLLIEMEAVQDSDARMKKSRAKRGTITHFAYVLKDRWRTLNGQTFQWKDCNAYKVGDYKLVFDKLTPHFGKLVIGQKQKAVNGRTSEQLFDGQGDAAYYHQARQKQIALEEIEGTLVHLWPGQDAVSKGLKRLAIETLFSTRSWTAVESKLLQELEGGLATLKFFERAAGQSNDALTDKTQAVVLLEICRGRALDELAAADMVPV